MPLNLLGSLAYFKDQSSSIVTQSFLFYFAKGFRRYGGLYNTHSWSTAGILGCWEPVSLLRHPGNDAIIIQLFIHRVQSMVQSKKKESSRIEQGIVCVVSVLLSWHPRTMMALQQVGILSRFQRTTIKIRTWKSKKKLRVREQQQRLF